MVLMQEVKKILLILNGKEIIFCYLDLKDLECINIHLNMLIFFVKININKKIESLNISNSAAIVFHHISYLKKKS